MSDRKFSRRQALVLGGGALAGVATAGSVAGARSADAASAWVRLPIVTANIGRKHLDQRNAAIAAVRRADPGNRPVVGWQEIREGDQGEPAMINDHFGNAYDNRFLRNPRSYRVPISVPAPWRIVNANNKFVHGVVPGASPPRWINEVTVEHNSIPGLTFVMLNTHYIYNAYNGDRRPGLRQYWDLHKQTHRDRVMNYHRNGKLVIWTADTNNPNYGDATGQGAERRVFNGGVDRINWLPADNGAVQLELQNQYEVPMNVDGHNARVAIFRIRLA